MQPILSVKDVRELEASIEQAGIDSSELMRRAGTVVAMQAMRAHDEGAVVVLAGSGNNAGDGWVAAEYLARHGVQVHVAAPVGPSLMRTDAARRAAKGAVAAGAAAHVAPEYDELVALLMEADVVIDAVFGTGFRGAMGEPFDMWVEAVDDYFDGALISVDVPSGIDATTGMAQGPCFQADVTLTMFGLKPGLVSGMGKQAAGQIVVAGLVGDDEGMEDIAQSSAAYKLGEADYADALPDRDEYADKYGHGRVLVVAGSARYPGAAVMAAKSAARAGAGYVTLAVPECAVPAAQAHLLSIPVVGLPSGPDGEFDMSAAQRAAELAGKADCVLVGPGMGSSLGAVEVVRALLSCPTALVADADALNALVRICGGCPESHPAALRREAPLVLTPHARELARLMGREPETLGCLAQRMQAGQELAWAVGSANFAVVAKGPVSCVSCIETTLVPKAGPAALGTAGTGDVLAGISAGLLAQQVRDFGGPDEVGCGDLALLLAAATRIQAVAAQKAVERLGSRGIMASDLIDYVGLAFDEVERRAALALGAEAPAGPDGFDDEPQMALDPEVEELITANGGMRMREVPGEVGAYEGDLDEPEYRDGQPGQDDGQEGARQAAPACGDVPAQAEAGDDAPCGAVEQGEGPVADQAGASAGQDRPAADSRACDLAPAPLSDHAIIRPSVRVDAQGREVAVPTPPAEKAATVPAFLAQRAAASGAMCPVGGEDARPVPAPEAARPAQPAAAPAGEPAQPAQPAQPSRAGVPAFLSQYLSASAPMPAVRATQPGDAAAPSACQSAQVEGGAPAQAQAPAKPAEPVAPSPCATTIMPALSLEDIARARAAAQPKPAEAEDLSPDIKARKLNRDRLEDFHARASKHAGDDEVSAPQDRPRARKVRRKK